jgi:hypothetical protein
MPKYIVGKKTAVSFSLYTKPKMPEIFGKEKEKMRE